MALRAISYLKSLFSTGKIPSQADFHDVFDSYVHKNDVEEINAAVVSSAINNYDTALKEVTEGALDTLGDVLKILRGFDTSHDLKAIIDAIGGQNVPWSSISNRPEQIQVAWEEQTISLIAYTPSAPVAYEAINYISVVRNSWNPSNMTGKRWVIIDMSITNFPILINGTSMQYFASRIVSVTIGVTPKISLK